MKVWLDGKIVDGPEARVPVCDHGLLFGDGVFEGIRVRGRRVYKLDGHLARLAGSANAVGIELPGGTHALRAIVLETLRAFDRDESYVRLLVTRGDGALGVDPATCATPRVVCIVDTVSIHPSGKVARGLDLVTASVRRPAADALDPGVKSLNYLNNVLAKLEANRAGADDALLLNAAGLVAEASVANVFAASQGSLATPPTADGALDGMTRAGVLELARELGIEAEERSLGRIDLLRADEVFLTGSGAGIVPVRSLDVAPIGGGAPGPLYGRITAAFPGYSHRSGTPF